MLPVFAWIGGVAAALITVLSLVAAVIVGVYVLSYAAHSLVTVIESTAAGNDAVAWPDEPIADWMARGIFLGALLMIWLGPSAVASRGLGDTWLRDNAGLRFLILAVPGLWLLFPIGLLSSLSASSKWIIFRPSIVGVLIRVFPATLMFYFLTAFLAVGGGAAWYYAVCRTDFALILFAGPALAAGFLLYARLLGRLSLVIHRLNPPREERDEKPKKKKRRAPADEKPVPPSDPGAGWDPIDPAPIELEQDEAPDEAQDKARHGIRQPIRPDVDLDLPSPLASLNPAPAGQDKPEAQDEFPLQPLERTEEVEKHWKDEVDDGPANPYEVSREPAAATPEFRPVEEYDMDEMGPQVPQEKRTGEGIVKQLDKPREQRRPRRKRLAPVQASAGPRWVWWQGVYSFPFYPTSLGAWAWLSVGFTVFGLCCGLVVANYPRGE
jgi:hypothetical protein